MNRDRHGIANLLNLKADPVTYSFVWHASLVMSGLHHRNFHDHSTALCEEGGGGGGGGEHNGLECECELGQAKLIRGFCFRANLTNSMHPAL